MSLERYCIGYRQYSAVFLCLKKYCNVLQNESTLILSYRIDSSGLDHNIIMYLLPSQARELPPATSEVWIQVIHIQNNFKSGGLPTGVLDRACHNFKTVSKFIAPDIAHASRFELRAKWFELRVSSNPHAIQFQEWLVDRSSGQQVTTSRLYQNP